MFDHGYAYNHIESDDSQADLIESAGRHTRTVDGCC